MTTRFRRTIGTTLVALTAASATLATAGLASAASVPCGRRTLSNPYSNEGDDNDYFAIDGGTFEPGPMISSWAFTLGAAPMTGYQEPKQINGPGRWGLVLRPLSTARTGSVCLYTTEAAVRFFYQSPGSAIALLSVTITATSDKSTSTVTKVFRGTGAGWALSPAIPIPIISGAGGTQNVVISFASIGGTFAIDDVMVDPVKGK